MTNQQFYLQWLNDFISVQGIANWYNLPLDKAYRMIRKGRIVHESQFGTIVCKEFID